MRIVPISVTGPGLYGESLVECPNMIRIVQITKRAYKRQIQMLRTLDQRRSSTIIYDADAKDDHKHLSLSHPWHPVDFVYGEKRKWTVSLTLVEALLIFKPSRSATSNGVVHPLRKKEWNEREPFTWTLCILLISNWIRPVWAVTQTINRLIMKSHSRSMSISVSFTSFLLFDAFRRQRLWLINSAKKKEKMASCINRLSRRVERISHCTVRPKTRFFLSCATI